MKITLTGASGFVGSHVYERLKSKHHLQCLKHTLSDCDVAEAIKNFRPELVIHVGSFFVDTHKSSDIEKLMASNLQWPTSLVDAAVESGASMFINTGTCWQSWENSDTPTTLYAATKSAFESILKFYSSAHGLKVINLWLLDTYGPCDNREKLISKLIAGFNSERPLEMSPGDQYLNLTHVSDVVDGFEHAIQMITKSNFQGCQTFELTHPSDIKLKDLVRLMEDVSGKKSPVHLNAKPYRAREVMKPSHLHDRLPGWLPKIDLPSGLKELCE